MCYNFREVFYWNWMEIIMKSQRTLKTVFSVAALIICLVLSMFVISFVSRGEGNKIFSIPLVIVYAFGVFLLLHGINEKDDPTHPVAFGFILLLIALTLFTRISLLPHQSDDYLEYLSIWLEDIRSLPGTQSVSADIGNYNMPYFYFLWVLGNAAPQTSDLYVIKLFSIVFDYVLAYYIMKLVSLKYQSRNVLIMSYIVALMIPSVILNGSMWGQCDCVFSAFALGALYYGLQKRSKLCWAFFAIAFSFKLQTVFLLPIAIVLIFTEHIRLKDIWMFFAMFVGLLVPAMIMGRSFLDCITIYWRQANTYSELSMLAANLYALLPAGTRSNIPVIAAAIFAAGTVVISFLLYLYLRKKRLTKEYLVQASFIFTVLIPYFLPLMHDRYFYLADTMACVFAFYYPKKWYIPALVIIPSMLCHTATLFENIVIPTWALSLAVLTGLCLLLSQFVKSLESDIHLN